MCTCCVVLRRRVYRGESVILLSRGRGASCWGDELWLRESERLSVVGGSKELSTRTELMRHSDLVDFELE